MISIDWLQVWITISIVASVFLVAWLIAYRTILERLIQRDDVLGKEARDNVRAQRG